MSTLPNPWSVAKLEEFLYFCCPECDAKFSAKEPFVLHAFSTHPRSKECLELRMQSDNVMVFCTVPQATSFELVQNLNQAGIIIQNNDSIVTYDDYQEIQDDSHSIEDYSNQYQTVKINSPVKTFQYQTVKSNPGNAAFQKVKISPGKSYQTVKSSTGKIFQKVKITPGKSYQTVTSTNQKVISPSKILKPTINLQTTTDSSVTDSNNSNKCGHCGKSFGRRADLTRHLRTIHDDHTIAPGSRIVSENNKIDVDLDLFDNPFVDKRQADIQNFCCDICDLRFVNSTSLSKHIFDTHDQEKLPKEPKVVSCTYCNKTFSKAVNLKTHVTAVHEGIRYQCQSCDKTYTAKSNLDQHVRRIHQGLKIQPDTIYECNTCGKQFSRRDSFRRHIKTMHN